MRAVTILAAASAFAGSGLADSNAIAAEMRNIRGKVHALNSSIVAWPGDILSGGDLLCKTVDLHKAFLSCARAIKESSPMSQKEYSASIQRELLPFANDIFDLADSVEKVKIDFANKNTIRLTQYEVLRAQQVPAKEFAQKAVKTLFEKLPRNIRGGNIFGKPLGTYVSDSFAKGLDKTIETLKPEKGQYSAIAKAISLAANIENLHSTDMEPFCRAQPQLSQLFSGTQSVGLETLMQRTNEILKSSGLDGQVIPFDMLQKISGPLGIPAEKIAAAERKSQGMNLGGFANNALTIIKNLGVQDQLITASRTNQFINQLIRNLENQGPRQGQVKVAKAPLRSRRHAPASRHDIDLFIRYAKLSAAAYQPQCDVPPENVKIIKYITDQNTGTDCFIAKDESAKEIIVSLRGTSDQRDVETDLEFAQVDYKSIGVSGCNACKVHNGFLTAWNSIAGQVVDVVRNEAERAGDFRVTITGHSLGGALACLASMSIIGSGIPATVYTYGQPRVGDQAFADFVDSKAPQYFRVTHANDGVPQIPFVEMGYQHNKGEFHQPDDSAESTVGCEGQEPGSCINDPQNSALGINSAHLSYMGVRMGALPGTEGICGRQPATSRATAKRPGAGRRPNRNRRKSPGKP